jgi:hypothetical protein
MAYTKTGIVSVSRNRYHNEIKLEQPDEVDDTLISWLREAYEV